MYAAWRILGPRFLELVQQLPGPQDRPVGCLHWDFGFCHEVVPLAEFFPVDQIAPLGLTLANEAQCQYEQTLTYVAEKDESFALSSEAMLLSAADLGQKW